MNKEVIKAMNRKPNNLKKWWSNNGYKVLRVVLFPLFLLALAESKIEHYLYTRYTTWDENRVNEILNYYIPRTADWDEDEKTFYFFDNGLGWNLGFAKKYLKFKDRAFWVRNNYDIREYLIEKFELEGFTKKVGNCFDYRTEITFYMNKE